VGGVSHRRRQQQPQQPLLQGKNTGGLATVHCRCYNPQAQLRLKTWVRRQQHDACGVGTGAGGSESCLLQFQLPLLQGKNTGGLATVHCHRCYNPQAQLQLKTWVRRQQHDACGVEYVAGDFLCHTVPVGSSCTSVAARRSRGSPAPRLQRAAQGALIEDTCGAVYTLQTMH